MQLVELRERGIEVGLVEDFGAVDQVAFDGEDLDHPPFSIEPSCEVPFRHCVTTAPSR